MKRKDIQWTICLLLAMVFIDSGLGKLLEFQRFQTELSKSPFVHGFAGFLAFGLPPAELCLTAALLSARTRLKALYASLFLMASFTFYIWVMMTKAWYLPCACMGLLGEDLGWGAHLAVNIIITLLILTALLLHPEKEKQGAKDTLHRLSPSGLRSDG